MDKDRVIGSAKIVKGKVKVAVGKAVGDVKLKSEGKADKIEGEVQNAVSGLKDKIRGKLLSGPGGAPRVRSVIVEPRKHLNAALRRWGA